MPVVGDEQIVEPVVVVVADGDGRGPAGAGQAGLVRHVRERAVAVVLVEAIGRPGRRALETGAAQDEEIEPAVVVVVEKRHSAAHHFDDVVLAVDAAVDDRVRQPCLRGDVGEARGERAARGLAARLRLDAARGDALPECGFGRAREPGEHRAARDHRATCARSSAAGSVATSVCRALTLSNV